MRGSEVRPQSATTPKQHQQQHQQQQQRQEQCAQAFLRPNSTSDSADGLTTTNSAGWPSATYTTGRVPCGVGLGVPRPSSASRLRGGHAHADSYMSKRELSYIEGNTRGCRKEKQTLAPPATTNCQLASKSSRLSPPGCCGLVGGDVSASFFLRRGQSAAAAVSHCPGRQSNSCCKATAILRSSGAGRPGTLAAGDSSAACPGIALISNVNNAFQSSCQLFGRDQCDEVCQDVAQAEPAAPAAPAAPTAPATPAAAAPVTLVMATEPATAAAAIPDALHAHRGGRRRAVSRAAVEAWAAAETWASILAVATEAVASGGGGGRVDAETENTAGIHSEESGGVKSDRRQRCDCDADIDGPGMGGCRCFLLSENGVSGRVCKRAAVHWRERVRPGSPLRGEAARAIGCCHHFLGGGSSRFSSSHDAPSRVSSRVLLGGRYEGNSFDGGKGAFVDTGVSDPMGLQGAAAAIVLWRIDRGEESWRRHAKRMGLAAFRAHCLQAGRRKKRDAMANMHWERASKVRGFRGMLELMWREGRRRGAATAVAAADVLTRARRMRKVLVMLRRNWQVCVALLSRDDVADLHFAECRLPGATRAWREHTRLGRSFHNAGILANRERRSRSLRAALTQWASFSLGDRARRRKVSTWRGALSSHHQRVADGFGFPSGADKERDTGAKPPRYMHVQGGFDRTAAHQSVTELPGGNLSTTLPTKVDPQWRPLSATSGVTMKVIAGWSRENEWAVTKECAGRTDLRDGCDAQEHEMRDGEKPRCTCREHEDMPSATAAGSDSAASQVSQTLVRPASATLCDGHPATHMTARATCDAHAVGDEEDEFREGFEGKRNRSDEDAVSARGLGSVGSGGASQCTTQGGCSSARTGGTMEGERGRGEEMAPLLARETADVGINETAASDESRGGRPHTSAQLEASAAMGNAPVVQGGSRGRFDGGGGYDGDEHSRCTPQGDVRERPSVVASSGRVGGLQETGAADDIVVKKTCAKSVTVGIDVGARPGIGSKRDILGGSVEHQRTAEEECTSRRTPIAASTALCKVGANGCTFVGTCPSSMVQVGPLGVPDREDVAVAYCKEIEEVEKELILPLTGQNDGRILPRGPGAGENICETGASIRQCSTLHDETTAVVSGGQVATSVSERGTRSLPPINSQTDDMSHGGSPSSVASAASSRVSLSRHLDRVTATRQSQTRGVFSTPNASFVNNGSLGECVAGPCTRSDGSDPVGPSATESGGGKEGRGTVSAGTESKLDTPADGGDVPSLSEEMTLRAKGSWKNEEENSARSFHGSPSRSLRGSELSVDASAGYVCSGWTTREGTTCARRDIFYEGMESEQREREEEVEINAKLCVKDVDGMPSAPKLATEGLEGHPVVSSAATPGVHAAHACLRRQSTEGGVGHRWLESTETTMPAHHTSTDKGESEVVPTCAAGGVSPSPLPEYRGGPGAFNLSVEHTMAGGVLEPLGPPHADAASFEKNSTGVRRPSLSQKAPSRRVSTKGTLVETVEITATISRREQLGHVRSLSTKQGRHSQLEYSQPAPYSPPASSENLGTATANLGQGLAAELATRPRLAVSVRSIPQDAGPLQHPIKRAASSSSEQTGARSNEQGVLLTAYSGKGRALSSELSSISWSDHCGGGAQKQPSSLESTEESTEKGTIDGDFLGSSLKRSTLLGEPLSQVLVPRTVSADVDSAMAARQPVGLRSSPEEKEELVENKVAAFLPLTGRHVPASTQKANDIDVPSTAVEMKHECHTPRQIESTGGGVRGKDAKELEEVLSNTDRSVRTRDDICERRNQRRLSTSDGPDHTPRRSHGRANTMVSADVRLAAAHSQKEPGSDGMVAGETRVASTLRGTIETAMRGYGIQSCAGDSVEIPVPGELYSSAESRTFGDSDGGDGLPASFDLQTRIGLDGRGTHPRVTADRRNNQNCTGTCGGLPRNRSAATVTRPKSDQGIDSSIDCERGIVPSSPELPPPNAASISSRGTEGTTRSVNRARTSSISTTRRASVDQVGGSRINVHDGLQHPPRGSLSTCSRGGTYRPPRVPESNVGSGGGDSAVGDRGRQGRTTSGRRKRSDKAALTCTSTSSSRSSCRRRDTLEEKVSEAFLRRRLQAIGFRAWHLQLVSSTTRRCSAYSLAIRASTFAKRVALTKWRTANATLLAVKAAAEARRCKLVALLHLGPRLTATMDNTAVAIVTFRRWHRRSAAKTLLRRAFCAWVSRTQVSRSAEACRCRVLAKRGLFVWRHAAQEGGRGRVRSRATAQFMLRAAAKRRFRAWRQRRKRQANALGVAEEYRAGTGNKNPTMPQRWHRSERLRARGALRAWMVAAQERAVLRAARSDVLSRVENRQRMGATRAWRVLAGDMRRQRCFRSKGDAQYAGRLGVRGLRGLRGGTLHARACRDALEVGDAHWKRRGATLIVETLRDLFDLRMRAFYRSETLRLRVVARAGLKSWRRIARSGRVAQSALENANSRLRKKMGKAILSTLTANLERRVAQNRAMRVGQQHLWQRRISVAVTSWRIWTGRQAAGAELYAAAGALHKSWAVSAGLRALDRVARARTARRDASQIAEQHLLRTAGLERWRAATTARRHAQGQTRVATLHWARNLSVKVWISWQVATVQQWARSRQEEAAAQHHGRGRKRWALRAWAAFFVARARHRDRGHCCSRGNGAWEAEASLINSRY